MAIDQERPVEIQVAGLEKSFGPLKALKGVGFEVRTDEVVALIGPSGSGKSTLLRCLNLLEMPDAGEILWEGQPVNYRRMTPQELSHHRTHMGMVFQHFHLFPHRKVITNVIEGPVHVLRESAEEARGRGVELLEQVGLSDKVEAWPSQLSGGQKQRVAIARALAMNPKVLLLDEVTSALDVEMIAGINDVLVGLARKGTTMVVVTHDLAFARSVADRVCFLDEGELLETGTPEELFDNPQTSRMKEFLEAVLAGSAVAA